MTGFHNTVGTAAMTNWQSPQASQIAFGRGKLPPIRPSSDADRRAHPGALGFVAINNADTAWSASFTTSLPDGTYCDVISGTLSSGACTGSAYVWFHCSQSYGGC